MGPALRPFALAVALSLCLTPSVSAEPRDAGTSPAGTGRARILFAPNYPIEFTAPDHVRLLHWLDSLCALVGPGLTGGKTVEAHRREFIARFGRLSPTDFETLQAYARARIAGVERGLRALDAADGATRERRAGPHPAELLDAFLEARDETGALEGAAEGLPADELDAVRTALAHFRVRFSTAVAHGTDLEAFVDRLAAGRRASELGRLLARVAAFYGVEPPIDPLPRVVLTGVGTGYGTHAMARGRHLLIEVRPPDGIADTASVIVHENAHYLMSLVDRERAARLEARLTRHGEAGVRAWSLLSEALPTALGQGIADRAFRGFAWSKRNPWYHREDVDRFAKAIYPVVRDAIETDGRLDEAFIDALWARYPFEPNAGSPVNRRSP